MAALALASGKRSKNTSRKAGYSSKSSGRMMGGETAGPDGGGGADVDGVDLDSSGMGLVLLCSGQVRRTW
jgi:hypothetical protein